MSMLGTTLLNEIVDKEQFTDAADILNKLRTKVKSALHQTGDFNDSTTDGMDCAVCIFNDGSDQMQYAGANNPLYLIRDAVLTEYEADRMPIGIHLLEEEPFTNNVIELVKGDLIYIFSDGFYDQFGGENGRKMFTRNFKQMLIDIHQLEIAEQQKELEQRFDQWKGNYRQIDDVLVIGMKV